MVKMDNNNDTTANCRILKIKKYYLGLDFWVCQ